MATNNNCSSVSIERETSWVIDLENKLARNNPADEEIQWKQPFMFRLPDFVRMMMPDVFTPKVVAIGPYHHHKSHLQPIESHKERALHHFLKRSHKSLNVYVREIKSVVKELQGSYVGLEEEWRNHDNFIKLMIIDGCFMLELMRLDPEHCQNYAPNDPFFSLHALYYKIPYMRRDMLILENQLPILVFKKLVSVEKNVDENEAEREITKLVVKFFVPSIYVYKTDLKEFTEATHGFHALDIYRRSRLFILSWVKQQQRNRPHPITNFAPMRSATRLHEAGITFKQSPSSTLNDIDFNPSDGILTLPCITVDDATQYEFLNMVALEYLHADCGGEISSYLAFMDSLMNSAEDVELLQKYGVVNNGLGSDDDIVRLFNSMSRELIVDQGGSLGSVQVSVEKYCRKSWNIWKANLVHTYLRNPWSLISGSAALFVILLTILSTVVAIFQWKNV